MSKPIEDPFKPDVLPTSRFHGPINIEEIFIIGQHILESKPVAPTIRELGVIDIHALTMAIKSGMHAETRVALDTLVTLSMEPNFQLQLVECDDLVDALVDCAQDQVTFLSEHATEVSDDMSLTSYEDLVRSCRHEHESLHDTTEFGTVAYDLERAADRLICITTLLRNFSFYEANFTILGSSDVVKLLSAVVRYLGTTEMFLRSQSEHAGFHEGRGYLLQQFVDVPSASRQRRGTLCTSFPPCLCSYTAAYGRPHKIRSASLRTRQAYTNTCLLLSIAWRSCWRETNRIERITKQSSRRTAFRARLMSS